MKNLISKLAELEQFIEDHSELFAMELLSDGLMEFDNIFFGKTYCIVFYDFGNCHDMMEIQDVLDWRENLLTELLS